jgi:methylenetetrahydrofolate dehydrogenase (NADP+)/methenyltetrahydrofolate cyclohydrolase/formyltetrahydrofolate synthetase
MTATKIDGTAIAKTIRERLGQKIKEKQGVNPRYKPSLKIVQGKHMPWMRTYSNAC